MDVIFFLANLILYLILVVVSFTPLCIVLYLKKYHGYFQRPKNGKMRIGVCTIIFLIMFFPLSLLIFVGKEI